MNALPRLDRIVRICSAAPTLARFYETALGFRVTGTQEIAEPAFGALLGVPGSCGQRLTLTFGEQRLDLLQIEPAGRPYPEDVPGSNALFQHVALQVGDLDQAVARLGTHPGWAAISVGGPQTLPPASGAVTAFKFRDPQRHPLELITPPRISSEARPAQISHSAISVQSSGRSIAFYKCLGLARTGGSINVGPEQDRLDGMSAVHVEVTALGAAQRCVPHLELLCYGSQFVRPVTVLNCNDIAADWLVFTLGSEQELRQILGQVGDRLQPVRFADGSARCLLRDPDGHWLCLEAPARGPQPPVANPG